jgi:hypothetical protein
MIMAKGSTRTLAKIKRGTVENGVEKRGMTVAGVLQWKHQLANVRGKRRRGEWLMTNYFILDTVYTDV